MASRKPRLVAEESSAKPKIFLVDDHAVLRDGLRRLLDDQDDLMIAGEAENARKAFGKLETLSPDLAIVDISLPDFSGIELVKGLLARFPSLLIIVLSMHDEALYAERALRAEAKGYVMKQANAHQLLAAIRHRPAGRGLFEGSLSSALARVDCLAKAANR